MDSSTAKMKQKPINAFFAASAKKEDPKSTQKKISAFFAGSATAAATPGNADNGAKASCGPAKIPLGAPPAAEATPVNQPQPKGGDPPPAASDAVPAAIPKAAAVPKASKAPAGGSTSKPKAPKGSASKAASGAKAAAKPASGASRRRLRRVVMEDEEGGGDVEAGLEDDVDDSHEAPLEDSDYEGASGSESDEDFSAEVEEEDEDDGQDDAGSEGDDRVGVGSKRKRQPTKASGPAKRTPAAAKTRNPHTATTPAGACVPAASAGRLVLDGAATPHPGTVSKGPATARIAGRSSSLATPGTVAPQGPQSAARSRGNSVAGGAGVAATPSSVRSGRTSQSLAETPSKSQAPGTPCSEVSLGVAASMDGEAARFVDRMAARFPFLNPDNIRDADRRRPDDPDYDPRTLYIPPTWFKEYKVSEGQQQWWTFKARNFDSVLLFKMGKFYEMFEMDAYVGVDVLGLTFMRGDQPHAGFPEVKYADMAESLARAGYRVVVIEQTETPEMLAKRNEQRRQQGLKLANVVERQKVAVLSRGTLVDAEMVASRPDASYVLAVSEVEEPDTQPEEGGSGGRVRIGLCAVDAASGQVLLGEFLDDEVRSSLRTQLTALQPQELVLPRKSLSSTTSHVLRNCLRDPRVNILRGPAGDWNADKTYKALRDHDYFNASSAAAPDQGTSAALDGMDMDGGAEAGAPAPPELDASQRWPLLLRRMLADGVAARPAAMAALGGVIAFLKDSLLDLVVMPLGRFEELPAPPPGAAGLGGSAASGGEACGPLYMALNGAALENLEILENADGGSAGTLLSVLDHCTTPFGRRRLRQWLCRPLGRIPDITARQDAVADLTGPLADAAGQARKMLAGVSDLERAVTRLHASTVCGASGRDAAHVVLYEDAGRRRVAALTSALRDLRAAHGALARIREAAADGGEGGGGSALLRRIVVQRCRPDEVASALAALEGATDWKEAAQTGRAVPEPGVDERYDESVAGLEAVQKKMQDYLKEVRQRFGREVSFVSVNKDSHLLEVPEATAAKMGKEFNLVGNRKGYKRYTSSRLKGLVAEHDEAMEAKEEALTSILARLISRFVQHRSLWVAVVEAVADLDALMSLAAHAMAPPDGGPMCRPHLVPPPAQGAQAEGASPAPSAVFHAVALRHPAGIGGRNNGAFVPNDVALGGGGECGGAGAAAGAPAPPLILLSGPNMGGKSTLLRQVCLATVLAQVGACVPASSLTLSPADALFVRMGARDSILTGQSTFFIELAETAAMLHRATSNSLVALDELGRGTATLDGAAVAGAVLEHLAAATRCRGLFATHYHHLSDQHEGDPRVAVMHMACTVEGANDGAEFQMASAAEPHQAGAEGSREVTFLYRLTQGACPRSYGTNVARLAGLPPRVVERAAQVSANWDHQKRQQKRQEEANGEGAGDMDVDGGAAETARGEPGVATAGLVSLLSGIRECLSAPSLVDPANVARLQRLQQAARQLGAGDE